MTSPAVQTSQLRCHHCQRWVGESSTPLEFYGMFKDPRDREMVPVPRDTYRCKSCSWTNVFRPANTQPQAWRTVELKHGA